MQGVTQRFIVTKGDKSVTIDDIEYDILKPFSVFERQTLVSYEGVTGKSWAFRTPALGKNHVLYRDRALLIRDLKTSGFIKPKPIPMPSAVTPILLDMQVRNGGYWIAPLGTPCGDNPAWINIGVGNFHRDGKTITVTLKDGNKAMVRYLYTVDGDKLEFNTGGTAMTHVKQSEALRAHMLTIAQQIAEAEQKEKERDEALAREPKDFDADTQAVIYFEVNFGREDGPTYTYVAVRANGKWYVTGRDTVGRTWEEMVDKYHSIRHGDFWTAAKWVHA